MKNPLNIAVTSPFIKKNEVILLAVLFFVINFILKIIFVSRNEIALDEPFSIWYAQMDLPSIFNMLRSENNPGLHFVILHFWIKLFGIGPFSVRFLSVIFSSLTASAVFLTGRKFFSARTGMLAGLIFTFSLFHVYFSHEARVYPLFVLLASLSLYYFLSLVHQPGKWLYAIALLVVNALMIYAHYFGFIVLATEFVSIFIGGNFRRIRVKMAVVYITLLAVYIPNILVFIQRFSVSVEHGTWVRKPQITELYGNLNRFLNSRTAMIVLLAIAAGYIVLQFRKHQFFSLLTGFFRDRFSRILFAWFALPYLGMFLVSFWVPMFLDRYILFTSAGFYLLIAVFITDFAPDRITFFASSALFLSAMLGSLQLAPDNNRRVDRVVQVVRELKAKDTAAVVIISPSYTFLEFTYHYNVSYFKDYTKTMSRLNSDGIYPLNDFSSFDETTLAGKKVLYLDCGTDFAFGKNDLLRDLYSSHRLIACVPVYEIYKIYWFRPGTGVVR